MPYSEPPPGLGLVLRPATMSSRLRPSAEVTELWEHQGGPQMNKWFVKKRPLVAAVLVVGVVGALAATAVAQSQRFPDVPPAHEAYEAIEWAAEVGVTTGYTDGTFKPEQPLVKRHAVVFMERYYDEILQAEESDDFTRGDMMVLLKAINDGISIGSDGVIDTVTTSANPQNILERCCGQVVRPDFNRRSELLGCGHHGQSRRCWPIHRCFAGGVNILARFALTALWNAGAAANTAAPTPHRANSLTWPRASSTLAGCAPATNSNAGATTPMTGRRRPPEPTRP